MASLRSSFDMPSLASPPLSSPRFASEAALVDCFVEALRQGETCWRSVEVLTEWDHQAGVVDVLARTGKNTLVAFEAKLSDWKRAFHQAYRNSSYANRVYVVMPRETVHRALTYRADFERRGIGLCSVAEKVYVHIKAEEQVPLRSWIRRRAHSWFDEVRDESERGALNCAGLLSCS